ncbi:site-specific integrase [Methanobacterium alkalithermotolerans]|uniref:Site-specific integrase n=1 Tax=Methanobacterium alkalithermotolerans TaxID=2731220 RepID=A0A8T8K6E7_9EURY|nr:site-specific integrase [Methanobacterium alkalithermotolerans]QUH24186.1 site-specific integrase [Methanobacterium alkalithermotolerans]
MKFDVASQDRIDLWVLRKDLEKSTLKSYLNCLRNFCELIGKTPDELILEADAEEEKGIKLRDRKINLYFLKFKRKLENDGKANGTIKLNIYALKSFYSSLDIQVPNFKTPRGDISLEKNYGKLISQFELQTLINIAASRERALIYIMALSGMAQAEARRLTIRQFMDAVGEVIDKEINSMEELFAEEKKLEEHILTIHLVRKKVNYRYITFIPPEATMQVISYLKERMYGRNQNIRIKDYESPIFVKINGEPIDRDCIVTNFRRVGLEAGFKKKKGAYSFWRAHGLRKYFISTIMNKMGDKVLADFLAGHKISDVDRAYWYMDPEDLKKRYIKALKYLSIDGTKVLSDDIKKLKYLQKVQDKMKQDMIKTQKLFEVLKENPELMEIINQVEK